MLDWTKRASKAIHSVGLLVIPNFSSDSLSEEALEVGNYTDGILAEGGFTGWSPEPNHTTMTTPPPKTTPEKFEAQVRLLCQTTAPALVDVRLCKLTSLGVCVFR